MGIRIVEFIKNSLELLNFFSKASTSKNLDTCPKCGGEFDIFKYHHHCANKLFSYPEEKRKTKLRRKREKLKRKGKSPLEYCVICGKQLNPAPGDNVLQCKCGYKKYFLR